MGNQIESLNDVPWPAVADLWTVCGMTVVTEAILIGSMIIIWRRSRYFWLVWTLGLLVIGNLFIAWANWGYALQLNHTYMQEHLMSIKLSVGIGTPVFNWF